MAGKKHTHSHTDTAQRALGLLRARGYRLTESRRALVHLLATPHTTYTAADLEHALPRIDTATIYRMLEMLAREHIVSVIRVPGAAVRYELADAHHHHIVCVECGTIAHLPCGERQRYATAPTTFREVIGHDVLLYGRCRSCV